MNYFECSECNKESSDDFELEHWHEDYLCKSCNEELPKECRECERHIDEEDTFCSKECNDINKE